MTKVHQRRHMAAVDTSALALHPLDYRLHGTPVLYLRRTYLVEDPETLEQDGCQVVRIDASTWESESDAHQSIAESLAFPDYYGHNISALHDCLGDVAAYDYGANSSATGALILLDNAGRFASENATEFAAIVDVFASAVVSAMTFGHRMLMLILVDDPNLVVPLSGGVAGWNPREWLDANRIHQVHWEFAGLAK